MNYVFIAFAAQMVLFFGALIFSEFQSVFSLLNVSFELHLPTWKEGFTHVVELK